MTEHQKELNNIRQARYRLTEKCKSTKARYRATEKGKATDKKHDLKHRNTPERKAYLKAHEQLPKTKARRKKYEEKPENKEAKYIKSLERFYKLSKKDYDEMLLKQDNKCAICFQSQLSKLSVDHCHTTGRVRGLLCRQCNLGIGCLKDNVNFLSNAITYLSK